MAQAVLPTAIAALTGVFPLYALVGLVFGTSIYMLRGKRPLRVSRLPRPLLTALAGVLILSAPMFLSRSVSLAGLDITVPAITAIAVFLLSADWDVAKAHPIGRFLLGFWGALIGLALVSVVPAIRPVGALLAHHENLLAAQVAILAFVVVHLATSFGLALIHRLLAPIALGLALLAALQLGSRSTLIGIVSFLLLGILTYRRPIQSTVTTHTKLLVAVGAIVMSVSLLTLVPTWRSHFLGWLGTLGNAPTANLIAASEDIGRPPWSVVGVQALRTGTNPNGHAVFRITKTVGSVGSQAQTKVALDGTADYRFSFWVRSDGAVHPGVRGWASATGTEPELQFRAHLDEQGAPIVSSRAPLSVAIVEWHQRTGGWTEVALQLHLETTANRTMWIGPTPDVRPSTEGATAEFSELMLQQGISGSHKYAPTFARSDSAETAFSRLTIFRQAWEGALRSPLIGNGVGTFVKDQAARGHDDFAFAHAHNVVLHILYERGILGLLGLIVMMVGLARTGRQRDVIPIWVVIIAMLAMNMTDYTLANTNIGALLGGYIGLATGLGVRSSSTPAA